jgi:hypothetical protein
MPCSQGDNKGFLVCKKKMATSADLLCRYTPPAFRQFTEAVVNLKFDEEPRYSAYVPLFEPLCGPGPQRPILLEEKSRVGQKRGREAFEGEDVEIVSLLSPLQCSRTLHAFRQEEVLVCSRPRAEIVSLDPDPDFSNASSRIQATWNPRSCSQVP